MSESTLNLTVIFPANDATIRAEIKVLQAMIDSRQAEIDILRQAISSYRKQCKHKGQKTGYNERDGAWGNPCPTCGYTY